MSTLNILIVDDSAEFTSGIKRLINSMGHTTTICFEPDQAKRMINQHIFDLALIDCFMPTTDGFTLAGELNTMIKEQGHPTKIILMSGILVDEASKKEAHSYPYVEDYLLKPLSKELLLKVFSNYIPEENSSVLTELLQQDLNTSDINDILTSATKIDGYELCYLLPLLSNNELSYKINLTDSATGNSFSINLRSGFLSSISSSEYNNSLGELLVGLGYLTREDLSSYLNSEAFKTSKVPIGRALVNLNLLSPHAVPVALKQQSLNRLDDLLLLDDLSVSFEQQGNEVGYDHSTSLNQYDIKKEARIWIESKLSKPAKKKLKANFSDLKFQKNPVLFGNGFEKEELDSILDTDSTKYTDVDIATLFSHLVEGNIEAAKTTNTSFSVEKQALLKKIESLKLKLKQNNPYSLLGVDPEDVSDQKISKSYQNLAKELHPDKINSILADSELEDAQTIFTEVTKAFNLIKTSDNRTTYESFKKNQGTQEKLQCNNTLEASKILLNKGEYSKAYEVLNTPPMHTNHPKEFGLYFLWAAIKSGNFKEIESKYSPLLNFEQKKLTNKALYYYIKAVKALEQNNLEEFQNFIQSSLKESPQFLPARRELQMAKGRTASPRRAASKSWFSFKKSS
ncbi:MAG: response regulator [Bdellovibrionales bacterium]